MEQVPIWNSGDHWAISIENPTRWDDCQTLQEAASFICNAYLITTAVITHWGPKAWTHTYGSKRALTSNCHQFPHQTKLLLSIIMGGGETWRKHVEATPFKRLPQMKIKNGPLDSYQQNYWTVLTDFDINASAEKQAVWQHISQCKGLNAVMWLCNLGSC